METNFFGSTSYAVSVLSAPWAPGPDAAVSSLWLLNIQIGITYRPPLKAVDREYSTHTHTEQGAPWAPWAPGAPGGPRGARGGPGGPRGRPGGPSGPPGGAPEVPRFCGEPIFKNPTFWQKRRFWAPAVPRFCGEPIFKNQTFC